MKFTRTRRTSSFRPRSMATLGRVVLCLLLAATTRAAEDLAVSDQVTVVNPFRIHAVAFVPDKNQIAVAQSHRVMIFDLGSAEKVIEFRGHLYDINDLAFSRDGLRLLTGSSDRTARVWDVANASEIRIFSGHRDRINKVDFSADGLRIATVSRDQTAIVWDIATGIPIRRFLEHESSVEAVNFAPDGLLVATGGADGRAYVWDSISGTVVLKMEGHKGPITDVQFSPSGEWVFTTSADNESIVWNLANGERIRTLRLSSPIVAGKFMPEREVVVTGTGVGGVREWEIASGILINEYLEPDEIEPVTDLDVSEDGTRLAVSTEHSRVAIWDIGTGTLELTIVVR